MKLILLALLVASPLLASASLPATCTFSNASIKDCDIPGDEQERDLRITSNLTVTYRKFVSPASSGIFLRFFNNGQPLRNVYLSVNQVDAETATQVTVDLRKILPSTAMLKGLVFESSGGTSLILSVTVSNGDPRQPPYQVWSAE